VRSGYVICDTCKREFEQHLSEMSWLAGELDVSLTRVKGVDYNRSGGRSAEKPLPWNEGASRARETLKGEMVSWVRIIAARTDTLPKDSLVSIAAWLLSRLERIAKREDAWVICDTITMASIEARSFVFAKPAPKHFIGPCEGRIDDIDGEITETECVGEIMAVDGAVLAECSACLRAYDVNEVMRSVQVKLSDHLLTSTEIAHLAHRTFGQPIAKVQKIVAVWASPKRKRIIAHAHTEDGVALYRYGDVAALLADTYGQNHAAS
jgi:hypothetical protein